MNNGGAFFILRNKTRVSIGVEVFPFFKKRRPWAERPTPSFLFANISLQNA